MWFVCVSVRNRRQTVVLSQCECLFMVNQLCRLYVFLLLVFFFLSLTVIFDFSCGERTEEYPVFSVFISLIMFGTYLWCAWHFKMFHVVFSPVCTQILTEIDAVHLVNSNAEFCWNFHRDSSAIDLFIFTKSKFKLKFIYFNFWREKTNCVMRKTIAFKKRENVRIVWHYESS